jgi:hypothetical protein
MEVQLDQHTSEAIIRYFGARLADYARVSPDVLSQFEALHDAKKKEEQAARKAEREAVKKAEKKEIVKVLQPAPHSSTPTPLGSTKKRKMTAEEASFFASLEDVCHATKVDEGDKKGDKEGEEKKKHSASKKNKRKQVLKELEEMEKKVQQILRNCAIADDNSDSNSGSDSSE